MSDLWINNQYGTLIIGSLGILTIARLILKHGWIYYTMLNTEMQRTKQDNEPSIKIPPLCWDIIVTLLLQGPLKYPL